MFDVRCKQCGAVNSMGSRFCESCGSALSGSAQPESQPSAPPSVAPEPPPAPRHVPPPPFAGSQPISRKPDQQSKAVASLVLGIVGFVFCGPLASIPGMILGKSELNAIREGRSPASNEAMAKAGFYVSLGVTILYGVILLAALGIALVPILLALIQGS